MSTTSSQVIWGKVLVLLLQVVGTEAPGATPVGQTDLGSTTSVLGSGWEGIQSQDPTLREQLFGKSQRQKR